MSGAGRPRTVGEGPRRPQGEPSAGSTLDLILIRVLPKACFPRIAAVAWENDVPLETVGGR